MTDKHLDPPGKIISSAHASVSKKLPVVGIGASAGGLEAFKIFFQRMPADTGMAFVMIPHLDPGHKSLMVEIIGRHTAMQVIQVETRMTIEPNRIYIVSPNRNLAVEGEELVPSEIPRHRGINLPVDFFFHSLAVAQQERAIGVILSGTMRDGAMGLKEIKEHGGLVIAQCPETAQHDGMPQSAIDTGMVDFVLPIEEMPDAIIKFIAHPYVHGETRLEDRDELNQVLAVVRSRSRYDFRSYKRNTLVRRTERRMGLRQIQHMADYVNILKNDPKETDALLKDLLIGVTGFFREEQVWERVREEVLPPMLDGLESEAPLRVWIPGCSTGEEAYTIAILVHEAFETAKKHFNAQIFATDIDGEAISKARLAAYPESIAVNVPPKYLKKYFVQEERQYHILRRVRESVVFAAQNLIGDAPFSNLNLISCRNLLIYLNPDIQQKIIELFHFSLRANGCLVLGNSETIGYHHDLFETVSKEFRIYRRIGQRDERMQIPIMNHLGRPSGMAPGMRIDLAQKNMSKLMQTQLLKRFAPAAVLIDKNFEILNLHGPTTQYLDLPQGDPVMELTTMIKEGLRLKLRGAVHKAGKKNETVTVSDVRVKRNGHYYPVSFTVSPIQEKGMADTLFLITFENLSETASENIIPQEIDRGEEMLVRQLEAELSDTRNDLQNTIEELETSNEELKASNEEMMSMNEELQSSNEELETSKEELQSMNEELNTVNAELREKVQELEQANNDLTNLMNSTDVATVFLDTNMSIRRFTPAARQLFNLIPSDVGRPIGDLAMRFSDDDLKQHTGKVMATLAPSAKEVETDAGQWYIRRILPFRTQDNRVDGLVLTFTDVSDLKQRELEIGRHEAKLKEKNELLAAVLEHTHIMAVYLDPQFNFIWVNTAYAKSCRYDRSFFSSKNHFELYPHEENQKIFQQVVDTGRPFYVTAKPFEFPDQPERGTTYWDWSLIPTRDLGGNITGLVFTLIEVTDRVRAEEALKKLYSQQNKILESISDGFFTLDNEFRVTYFNRAAEVLLNRKSGDVIGNKLFDAFPEARGSIFEEKYTYALKKKINLTFETHFTEPPYENWYDVKVYPFSDGITIYFQVTTEKRQADEAIRESERKFRNLAENAPDVIARFDKKFRHIYVNPVVESITGLSPGKFIGKTNLELGMPEALCRFWDEAFKQTFESRRRRKLDFDFNQGSERRSFEAIIVPETTQRGAVKSLLCITRDITDRKRAEEELQHSERKFRAVAENVPGLILKYRQNPDDSGEVLYISKGVEDLYEISRQEAGNDIQRLLNLIHEEDRDAYAASFKKSAQTGSFWEKEYRIVLPDGRVKWIHGRGIPNQQADGSIIWDTLGIDITDRKNAEQALQSALADKEVLLREVHHRVKNNMQVIVGLLRMHARRTDNTNLTKIFADCQNRIQAMSLIHEALYQSDDLTRIDFQAYLKKLCRNLGQAHDAPDRGIALTVSRCDVNMNMDQGIAVGMVVSELVSNAFKHAFPFPKGGNVWVRLTHLGSNLIELVVADDGKGLASKIDLQHLTSLGLRLATNIVTHELGGTIDVERNNGTKFIIRFQGENIQPKGEGSNGGRTDHDC